MRMTKKCLLFGILGFLIILLAACVDVSNEESTDETDSDPVAEETTTDEAEVEEGEKVVKIGYSGPLSGPGAQYGANVLNGVKMAANEINENGFEIDGTTYKIELVALDDKYLPNETGVNVKRMVSEDDPVAIYIPHSGGVFATQEFNEEDDFIIMAYTSEPRMYEQGNELLVGVPPKYSVWREPFTDYMMENFGPKMAMLPTASQYGKDWTESITPVWEENGGEIVFENDIDFSKETDYFTVVTNALNENPDVLFVGGPSEPTALVIKQAKELGFEGGFMIMDQAKIEEMAGFLGGYEMLNGSIGLLPIESYEMEATQEFVKTYKEKFDADYATSESALNYQSMFALVEAMKAAGSVDDTQAIMDAFNKGIENIPEENMVTTLTGINEDGSLQWESEAAAVENGEVIAIPVD
ncbi:ABC transporter substrate-binding protein [Virgibacillus salinus]|uniref:Amino acid/amide ABC transporter substrate-binding protein, HAAT family n=1 Tax=Virgibacillus salinus TaxID=553311 RepID=A0A1H1EQU1_9BACI|nr:ABC transporter substrate-binding protein [Virgibacillus salinus]SDQ91125.1 amino acid/amide ABC transporter substrate-binding protein, HAAT family [Virgibacillus salinus]